MGPQIQPTYSSLDAAGTACQPRAPTPYPPNAYIQIKNNLLPVTKTESSTPSSRFLGDKLDQHSVVNSVQCSPVPDDNFCGYHAHTTIKA